MLILTSRREARPPEDCKKRRPTYAKRYGHGETCDPSSKMRTICENATGTRKLIKRPTTTNITQRLARNCRARLLDGQRYGVIRLRRCKISPHVGSRLTSSFSCERGAPLVRGRGAVDGAGVGARVVGPEAVGASERPVLKVPYLLASGAKDKPVEATAVASLDSRR